MFELVFVDFTSGKVKYKISDVRHVRYIIEREVGFIFSNGRLGTSPLLPTEHLEVRRVV